MARRSQHHRSGDTESDESATAQFPFIFSAILLSDACPPPPARIYFMPRGATRRARTPAASATQAVLLPPMPLLLHRAIHIPKMYNWSAEGRAHDEAFIITRSAFSMLPCGLISALRYALSVRVAACRAHRRPWRMAGPCSPCR